MRFSPIVDSFLGVFVSLKREKICYLGEIIIESENRIITACTEVI